MHPFKRIKITADVQIYFFQPFTPFVCLLNFRLADLFNLKRQPASHHDLAEDLHSKFQNAGTGFNNPHQFARLLFFFFFLPNTLSTRVIY